MTDIASNNITELERIEAELRELNAGKDKFFSIISHDLRNPVTFILGLSDLLLTDVETLSLDEIKIFAFNINRSAKSLSDLLENLLQWAEIQRGRIEYQPIKVDLDTLVKANLNLLQGNADDKKINLFCEIEANCPVYVDRNMINSVIQNLISNAIKFSYPGGDIKITARQQGDFVEVSVADTGVGMSPEAAAKLFGLDTHQTTAGTAGEKGTGLGLLLCKEFVEMNGGQISVESTLDQGTTFKFSILVYRDMEAYEQPG